jgi:MYXO-CTERM domain-containing protein
MRRVVLWALVAVVWVSVFGAVRGATAEPRSLCEDFSGDLQPPIACFDNGPSLLPALPIASAAAAIVAVGGLALIRRREDEPQ